MPSHRNRHPLRPLALLVLATAAQAAPELTADLDPKAAGTVWQLTVTDPGGPDRDWTWSLLGVADASRWLRKVSANTARFQAPETLVEDAFTVVAQDAGNPPARATLELKVAPKAGSGVRFLMMEEAKFADAFTPALKPFLTAPLGRRVAIRQIAFCDDPGMGPLDRCWILAGHGPFRAVHVSGVPVELPGSPAERAAREDVAVAARPRMWGPAPPGVPSLVLLSGVRITPTSVAWSLQAVEPDGGLRPLAGLGFLDSAPRQIALDRMGSVYLLLDGHGQGTPAVWKCAPPDYRPVPFCGDSTRWTPMRPVWDPEGGPFQIKAKAMALDPATGDLYLGEATGLYRIAPDGGRTLVIGAERRSVLAGEGFAYAGKEGADSGLAPLRSGRVPLDTSFQLMLESLAVHGRELILVTKDNICAFHLDTRRLAVILDCDLHGSGPTRWGPVPYLNPGVPGERAARLSEPGPLGLTPEGMCVVTEGLYNLAELELPDTPITTVMDPSPGRAGASDRAGAPAGPVESKDPAGASLPPKGAGSAAAPGSPRPNLWPGRETERRALSAQGNCRIECYRDAREGWRFSGQCRFQSGDPHHVGLPELVLRFYGRRGVPLGAIRARPGHDPGSGPVPLQVSGAAPAGATVVEFALQVRSGNPGATVTFDQVTWEREP